MTSYTGPERRVVAPSEVQRLTEQVARLVETNTSLDGALRKIGEISERQVGIEQTIQDERALVRARWSRDNYIVALLVVVLVALGIVVYRQHNFSRQNAAQITGQEEQRLDSLQITASNCADTNRSKSDQLGFLQSVLPLSQPPVQVLIRNYLAVYPPPTDCSVYDMQIKSLQKQLGHG